MGDPRNIAHAKKVTQEKHHKGDAAHVHQPPRKTKQQKQPAPTERSAVKTAAPTAKPEQKPDAAKLEKSLAVLPKFKELAFDSRANTEQLPDLALPIEYALKHRPYIQPIGR